MRNAGLVSLCLALLALAPACGGGSKKKTAKPGGGGDASGGAPDFLSLIPDDTPYVFATLQRTPKAYIKREYLESADEAERIIELLTRFRQKHPKEFQELGVFERLTFELLAEVKGKLSEDGLASLGIRLDAYAAFYGIGVLPVLRIELLDPDKFQAAVERVLDRAGVRPQSAELEGQTYWTFRVPELDQVEIAVAVVGNELVATAVTDAVNEKVLPLVFGTETPETSLADSGRLQEALERHQFAPWGVGYIDLIRLARTAVGDVEGLSKEIAAGLELAMDEPACVEEIPALVEPMPRIVLGTFGLTERAVSGAAVFELRDDVAGELHKMSAWVPGLTRASVEGAPLTFGVGLNVQRLLDFAGDRLAAIAKSPYRCSALAKLNRAAQDAGQGLAMFRMGPFAKITGINVILEEMELGSSGAPEKMKGYFFLGTDDPAALLQAAAQYIGSQAASVKPGAPPVRLNMPGVGALLGDTFVAAADRAIGVSIGPASDGPLARMLAKGPVPDPPLFLSHIDPQFASRLEQQEEVSSEYADIAVLDPELARALTEMDRGQLDQYDDLFIVGRTTEHGLELRFDAVYRE